MRVIVTGASGFIGRHVIAELRKRSIHTRVVCRNKKKITTWDDGLEIVYLSGSGHLAVDWLDIVSACDVVIHLAGRAHIVRDKNPDPAKEFHLANVDFACACAAAAVSAGIQKFIFISSIGVHGGVSTDHPFNINTDLSPHTLYAKSKAKAEQAIAEVVRGSSVKLTIIRPPLVYGPGVPGNFHSLMQAVQRGRPLPLGAVIRNRRSLVGIDNLVDLIMTCLFHPEAANRTFLVSDDHDCSTAELVRNIGYALGKPAWLIPIPPGILRLGAKLVGKYDIAQRLLENLQVDISHTKETLSWKPPVSLYEGLRNTAKWYLNQS